MPVNTRAMSAFFAHAPFDNPSTQIRLVTLGSSHARDRANDIHCTLIHHELAGAPDYVAASYTWGDPNTLKTIFVNGQPLVVRASCWHVLHQARSHGVALPIWIDALCINQKDTAEKALQVAIMGSVYRKAAYVMVNLGLEEGKSGVLLSYIQRLSRRLGSVEAFLRRYKRYEAFQGKTIQDPAVHYAPEGSATEFLRDLGVLEWFSELTREETEVIGRALTALISRPYFYRVWVVQETFLASRATVVCGDSAVDLADLFAFAECYTQFASLESEVQFEAASDLWHSDSPAKVITYFGLEKAGLDLRYIGISLPGTGCTDCRDRIFGLLEVMDWKSKEFIKPDYSISTFGLCHQVLRNGYLDEYVTNESTEESFHVVSDPLQWLHVGPNEHAVNGLLLKRRPGGSVYADAANSFSLPTKTDYRVQHIDCWYAQLAASQKSNSDLVTTADHLHNTSIADSYGFSSPRKVRGVHRRLMLGDHVIGYLPASSRPGDIVAYYPVSRYVGRELPLILRHVGDGSSQLYIVGQAVLRKGLRKHELPFVTDQYAPSLRMDFSLEDYMIWICQDEVEDTQWHDFLSPPDIRGRLKTLVCNPIDAMSSFGTLEVSRERSQDIQGVGSASAPPCPSGRHARTPCICITF